MSNVTPLAPQRPSRTLLDPETEFTMLFGLKERTSARLDELTVIIRAAYGLPPSPLERMRAEDAERAKVASLPLSGLVQTVPGILMFKRGRDA